MTFTITITNKNDIGNGIIGNILIVENYTRADGIKVTCEYCNVDFKYKEDPHSIILKNILYHRSRKLIFTILRLWFISIPKYSDEVNDIIIEIIKNNWDVSYMLEEFHEYLLKAPKKVIRDFIDFTNSNGKKKEISDFLNNYL